MEVNHFKQYLPKEFEGGYKNNRRYIHAVICVYLLTIIQPEYKKITYHEFITNFQKYVKIVNFEDNPCLIYQTGKNKGQLKIPNENTFVHKWISCYNVPDLIEEFKEKVSQHIVTHTARDVMPILAEFIEKESESYNTNHNLHQRIANDITTPDIKKPYPMKAAQESKSNAVNNIKTSFELMQDYLTITQQQSNQSEVYNPNHDRIIDRYHNMENEWEED